LGGGRIEEHRCCRKVSVLCLIGIRDRATANAAPLSTPGVSERDTDAEVQEVAQMIARRMTIVAALGAFLTGCQTQFPRCEGLADYSIDGVWDGSEFRTREDAAIHALEVTFVTNVGSVVLARSGARQYLVVAVDGRRLDAPPTVDIEPVGDGFAPSGVRC
jgi:hypothetical protein